MHEFRSAPVPPGRPTGGAAAARPAYLALHDGGELAARAAEADRRMEDCDLCARYCRTNRKESLRSVACRTGERAVVASYGPHHGEESPLSGWAGSGTIFFSWCNQRCDYCQNADIARRGEGEEVDAERLAGIMLSLQAAGCHNVNLVSPSHVVAQILAALDIAAARGLRLPLVYNTGGYDSPEALALLDGAVDIYIPDMKYGASEPGRAYSHVRGYAEVNRAAVAEMHRQVGDLEIGPDGIARRGLLIRHLVLPGGVAGTEAVLRFLAEEVSPRTYLNLLTQYRPCYRAGRHPELDRRPAPAEFAEAFALARRYGLSRLDERRAGWR
jgi:putative pyruvate formate lyase activating enzyme